MAAPVAAGAPRPPSLEKQALAALRARLPPTATECDDNTLLRFLRARRLDPTEALTMFTETSVFRKHYRAGEILNRADPLEAVYQHMYPAGFHKFSKEGYPIYLEKTGLIRYSVTTTSPAPELLKHMSEEDLAHRHIRIQEGQAQRCQHASSRLGRLIEKQVVIMDMAGLSLKPDRAGLRVFQRVIKIDQQHYPERLHKFFVINGSGVFRALWKMIQLWLDPITKAKFEIMGSDYKTRLLEFIDPECLPKEWGGSCVCDTASGTCMLKTPVAYKRGTYHASVRWRLPETDPAVAAASGFPIPGAAPIAPTSPASPSSPPPDELGPEATPSKDDDKTSELGDDELEALAKAGEDEDKKSEEGKDDESKASDAAGDAASPTEATGDAAAAEDKATEDKTEEKKEPAEGETAAPSDAPATPTSEPASPTPASSPSSSSPSSSSSSASPAAAPSTPPVAVRYEPGTFPLNRVWESQQARDERDLAQLIQLRITRPLPKPKPVSAPAKVGAVGATGAPAKAPAKATPPSGPPPATATAKVRATPPAGPRPPSSTPPPSAAAGKLTPTPPAKK